MKSRKLDFHEEGDGGGAVSAGRLSGRPKTKPPRLVARLAAAVLLFLAGTATGFIARPNVVSTNPEPSPGEAEVEVLVASKTIPAGTELGYAVLMRARMPARFVSVSMVRPEHVGQLVGEKVLMTILEGDPILWSQLAVGAPDSICDWVREANQSRDKR